MAFPPSFVHPQHHIWLTPDSLNSPAPPSEKWGWMPVPPEHRRAFFGIGAMAENVAGGEKFHTKALATLTQWYQNSIRHPGYGTFVSLPSTKTA
jgi:hypothetical protein